MLTLLIALGAGKGGFILWPLFGATNQLLVGLSFLVIAIATLLLEAWMIIKTCLLMPRVRGVLEPVTITHQQDGITQNLLPRPNQRTNTFIAQKGSNT